MQVLKQFGIIVVIVYHMACKLASKSSLNMWLRCLYSCHFVICDD